MKYELETKKTQPIEEMRRDRVGVLAYEMWEQEGRPEGRAEEHWLNACLIVDGEIAALQGNELPSWLNRAEKSEAKVEAEVIEPVQHKQQRRSVG